MARDTHKIVAILFSDVVGYAHVTDPDRTAPIDRDDETRSLVRALTQQHQGEWLQEIGDAVLCTFGSAATAIKCALEIQRRLSDEFEFRARIGIHVGDLVFRTTEIGTDVFGDAVNVAARVQALAESGGILVTERVYRDLRVDRSILEFEDLGEQSLKNVNAPVRVYRVNPPARPVSLSDLEAASDGSGARRWQTPAAVLAIAVLLAVAAAWLFTPTAPESSSVIAEQDAAVESNEPIAPAQADAPGSVATDPEETEKELQTAAFAAVRTKLLALEGNRDFAPRVWTIPDPVKDEAAYQVGIEASCSCTALLFAIDGSADSISLLYPNPFHTDGSIRSGEVLEIPSSGEWIMRAVGGEGIDAIKLIVVEGLVELGIASDEIWSVAPDQPERVAELEALLVAIEALHSDSASAPLQIIP